ncbi:MAG: ABC transporter permease [Oscillospiraceae bacterium]|nr:ABC transporter permease [Oscillospiraceae bacterium]
MNILKLVARNLFRKKGRFVFTLLGISIGMASFVALLSMGENMQSVVKAQAESLGASFMIMPENICIYNQMAIVTGETISESMEYKVFEDLTAVNDVTIIPHLTQKTSIKDKPSVVAGILPRETYAFKVWEMNEGVFFESDDQNAVVVGIDFAETRNLRVGETVTVKGEQLPVIGILAKTQGNDDMTMFAPLTVVQRLFNKDGYISYMSARVKDMSKIEAYEDAILKIANVQVATNDKLLESVLSIIGSVNSTLRLIAGVALIAAAFGIINTMMTAVYERRREIGILCALGGRAGTIFKVFLIESGVYGLLGGCVGVVAGYVVSVFAAPIINREGLDMLKGVSAEASIDIKLVLTAVIVSFVISILSGLYPALKASKLTPVEAVSYG